MYIVGVSCRYSETMQVSEQNLPGVKDAEHRTEGMSMNASQTVRFDANTKNSNEMTLDAGGHFSGTMTGTLPALREGGDPTEEANKLLEFGVSTRLLAFPAPARANVCSSVVHVCAYVCMCMRVCA